MMLQLHDRMKEDAAYQKTAPQTAFDFRPVAWMAFTDAVSHAAMREQYQLEQTFLLPVGAMLDEQQSPLRSRAAKGPEARVASGRSVRFSRRHFRIVAVTSTVTRRSCNRIGRI